MTATTSIPSSQYGTVRLNMATAKKKSTKGYKGVRIQRSLRVPKSLDERLQSRCNALSMDVNTFVVQLIRTALNDTDPSTHTQG